MKIAIHQPDLLPYSGFWYKLATSDGFIISRHDQFQKHGYQRRVTMRDTWCSHQLVGKPALVPITDVEVAEGWQERLVNVVRGRYATARHYQTRGRELCDRILSSQGTMLDEVNLALLVHVKEMLGIGTPFLFTDPPVGTRGPRLIHQVLAVGGTEYLSGAGGASYLGEGAAQEFADAGITLSWSAHHALTGDSIVTVLMDHDDPMASVLNE